MNVAGTGSRFAGSNIDLRVGGEHLNPAALCTIGPPLSSPLRKGTRSYPHTRSQIRNEPYEAHLEAVDEGK